MKLLKESDLRLIANGASFLASGGGGSVSAAHNVIDNIVSFSKSISVATVDELPEDSKLMMVCGVGAPDAKDMNFKNSPGYAVSAIESMTQETYSHVFPIEVGAMNSVIPMLVCAQKGLIFIDGDGAGRSVPQMSMCTYAENNFSSDETIVVSESDQAFPLHPENNEQLESQVRNVVSTELDDIGTTGTWSVTGSELQKEDAIVKGSISLARTIGAAMESEQSLDNVCSALNSFYPDYKVIMTNAKVIDSTNQVKNGFDIGTITFQDMNDPLRTQKTFFVNESLLAAVYQNNELVSVMMGPDMLCSMGVSGQPMTNSEICSDFAKGDDVHVSLVWVQAVDAIRTAQMRDKYIKLIIDKFGDEVKELIFNNSVV